MTNEDFELEVSNSYNRSKKLLLRKGLEYTHGDDRLGQFYKASAAQGITPTMALVGMMAKHFISISDMSKDPLDYATKTWDSKICDLRNYTFLLDALIRDMNKLFDDE